MSKATKRKPPKKHGEATHPAGYFLELVLRHNWPPSFTSRMPPPQRVDQSALSTAARERQVAQGITGSILGVSAKADALIKQFRRAR